MAPLFAGAAWAGTLVWDAAVVLANHLLNDVPLKSLRVLELGAGMYRLTLDTFLHTILHSGTNVIVFS